VGGVDHATRIASPAEPDQSTAKTEIARASEQNALGRLPVAPGATDLLIVCFDRTGCLRMDDGSDVGSVDTHSERIGGHDDIQRTVRKAPVDPFAHRSG
jgi:hypothetical protein